MASEGGELLCPMRTRLFGKTFEAEDDYQSPFELKPIPFEEVIQLEECIDEKNVSLRLANVSNQSTSHSVFENRDIQIEEKRSQIKSEVRYSTESELRSDLSEDEVDFERDDDENQ